MIIDAHQHVYWHGKDDSGLIEDMDKHGISKAWLLTWEIPSLEDNPIFHNTLNPVHYRADGTHAGIPLEDVLRARDRHPKRFEIGYCPHPSIGNPARLFESAYHIHGVRICGEWKCRMLVDDPRSLELFQKAGELSCPVVIHLDIPYRVDEDGKPKYRSDWYGGTVASLERVLQACPDTVFLGHAPGFWREICANADRDPRTYPKGRVKRGGRLYRLFETYPNLYGDLSAGSGLRALKRDTRNARKFIDQFADRLLFARDTYGDEHLKYLNSLKLPKDLREKLFFRNAQKLLKTA